MSKSKVTWITLLCIAGFILLIFAINEFEIFGIKFWGVRKADANRKVFEQSQSYVEGKRQDLIKYRLEYMRADSADKVILKNTIAHAFANFDGNLLEPELKSFLDKMKFE